MQAQFSALQQQRLLQGLPPQQHLHDTASLQLQQLQQHQHHQQLQLQQQQANFLQSAGQCAFFCASTTLYLLPDVYSLVY